MKIIIETNRNAQLQAEGWERRTITGEPRLTELVELYKELNLEVHLEPATPQLLKELNEECQVCFRPTNPNNPNTLTTPSTNKSMIIYTRNKDDD